MSVSSKQKDILDPNYGSKGISTPDQANVMSINYTVKIGSGRLCLGLTKGSTHTQYVLMRVDKNGKLDQTFGDDGRTIGSFEEGSNAEVSGVYLKNGYIIITGSARSPQAYNASPALARFTMTGMLDKRFGNSGHKIIEPPQDSTKPSDPTQPRPSDMRPGNTATDDGVFITYRHRDPHTRGSHAVLMKFDIEGEYDRSFNGEGYKFLKPEGSTNSTVNIGFFHDRKIYLFGEAEISEGTRPYIACLEDTGQEHKAFGDQGYLLNQEAFAGGVYGLAKLDAPGNIIFVTSSVSDDGYSQGILDACTPAGERLESFNTITTRFGDEGGRWSSAHISPSGKIILTGLTLDDDQKVVVGRFAADGTPDTTFGDEEGCVQIPDSRKLESKHSDIEEDGKTIICGLIENTYDDEDGFLLRCQTDG